MATYPEFISLKEAFFELIIKHMHSFRRQKLLNDILKILTAFVIAVRSKKSRAACRNMICDQLTNELDEALSFTQNTGTRYLRSWYNLKGVITYEKSAINKH